MQTGTWQAFASTDKTVVKEVWFYSFVSLLSEIGGALGLFLGFSFLGTLDLAVYYGAKLCQRLKTLIENRKIKDSKYFFVSMIKFIVSNISFNLIYIEVVPSICFRIKYVRLLVLEICLSPHCVLQ